MAFALFCFVVDALLADLQSTTQHISYQHSHPPQPSSYQQYHHHHQQHPYAYSSANDSPYGSGPRIVVRKSDSSASSQDSRESTPPLPPPPALELLDSVPAYRTPDVSVIIVTRGRTKLLMQVQLGNLQGKLQYC